VGTATTNSYSDSGLSAGTTYRYRVTAYDLAGNASSYSSYTSATTLSVDVTPPIISSVSAGGITISGGTITWTTNELSDSLVEYGLTTGYGASSVLNSSPVTSHSIILSSLSPGTVYHYRVKSADSSGNLAVSADQTLTTLSTTDTTSPLVPTSLSATAVSTSTINLTWTASTDPTVAGQLTSGIAGYKIYRGGIQIGTSATNSYSDTGLSASTQYTYTVSAYDIAGNNSAQSTSASATTQTPPPDTTPPTTPTSPVATAVSTTAINVTWTASTDAVGVTGYKIFRCVGTSCTATTQVGTTTINSYSDSGLSAGTTYRYRIIATDLAGNLSAYSTSASATTQALPDTTPPTVSMTAPPAGSTVSGTVTLTATASDNVAVQSVQFTVDGTNVGNLDTVAPYTISWDSSSVANGLRTIRAKATDTSGNTTTSSALFVTVAIPQSSDTTPPPVPINVQSSNTTSNSTTITWSPSTDLIVANQVTSGTAGYKVYRGTVLLATVSTGLTYTDTNLTPEDSYSYSVSAFDLAGNTSDQSAYLHVTTLPAPVVTPPPSGGGGGGGGGGSTPAPAPSGGGGGSPTTVYIPPTSTSTTSATTTLQITGGTTAPNITMFLPKLTTILYLGMRGGEVSILQQFLIQRGYLETTSLGYFGTKTQAGVKKYQCDNKIVCTGSESTTGYGKVGPKTRNLINSQIGAAGTTETEQQRVARLTAMIAELLKTVTKLQEQLRGMGR
jgi:chitodextrinase